MIESVVGAVISGLVVGLIVQWTNRSANDDKETRKENVNLKYAAIGQTIEHMEERLNERFANLEGEVKKVAKGLEGVRNSQAKQVLKSADIATQVAILGVEVQNFSRILKLISRRSDHKEDEDFGNVIRKDK